ncbi:MAG: beta-galactosidase [Thermotogota bacterium]
MIGVDYYPEHWDSDLRNLPQMANDLIIMKENGIELIRVGEFAWHVMESSEGEYDFSLLDKLFELTRELGINVIIGTPSATPPAWLIKKHPEILQKDDKGHTRHFGGRRHYCYNSHIYKVYVDKIVHKLAERYGEMDNLYAWQIDNEFGCEDTTFCYCDKCDTAFQKYLEQKYSTIDDLNRDWGSVFWSQKYNDFSQIETPKRTNALRNPHQLLDFYRFSTDSIMEFAQMQIDAIKRYSPKPITHNLMTNFTEINYKKLESQYDFLSFDNYHFGKEFKPWFTGMNFDLMWSLQRQPFTIMEQQPGRVNWQVRNVFYDYNWMEKVSRQALSQGANNIVFFRYRALPFGAEQYHNGILNYDGNPERSKRLQVCKRLNEVSPLARKKSRIGIYFDYEVAWMHAINGVNKDFDYFTSIMELYRPIFEHGEQVDFLFRDSDFQGYDYLIIPYALFIPEEVLKKISETKSKVIMTCMSAMKDKRNHIISQRPLGLNMRGIELEITDFGAIFEESVKIKDGEAILADMWFEEHHLVKGKSVADYTRDDLKGHSPLVISEDNKTLYVGTITDYKGWKEIYRYFGLL